MSSSSPPYDDQAPPCILLVEARFYADISAMLFAGAERALEQAQARYDRIEVPGALEIPTVIRLAQDSKRYDGYVALGCVIRGETSHYDIVADQSARGLIELGINHQAIIGNGILTTDNGEQARRRADPDGKDKGGDAVRAVLALLQAKRRLHAR